MSLLANANTQTIDTFKDEESFKYASFKNKILHRLKEYIEENRELKIGYVLSMTSIRATLKTVFNKNRNGLRSKMVIGPTDVVGEMFDILLVDETHRISKRKNLSWIGEFDKCCKELNLKPEKTNTLDWIVRSSKHRILFYDKDQSIKPSDISIDEIKYSLKKTKIKEYKLVSQMRCEGGNLYINYLEKIFKCTVTNKEKIENYDIKVFNDPNKMIESIKKQNDKYGLCRNVAGYSWEWRTKNKTCEEIKSQGLYDIKLGHKTYL